MRTPRHLWIVGVLALLWNAGGAMDYALTQLNVAAYTDAMPEGMRAVLDGYPVWMTAIWALAVWLPVAGAVLLLLRRAAAAPVFGVGLVCVILAGLWNYVLMKPPLTQVAGAGVPWFWIAVVVIAVAEWLYARTMARRGVLR